MSNDRAVVILNIVKRNTIVDIEVPLNITANELVVGLNTAYDLGIDVSNVKECYLKTENPIALLRGNRLLSDFGIRNGTVINFTE